MKKTTVKFNTQLLDFKKALDSSTEKFKRFMIETDRSIEIGKYGNKHPFAKFKK